MLIHITLCILKSHFCTNFLLFFHTYTCMVGPHGVRQEASVQRLAVCNTCNRLVLLMVGNKSPPPFTKSPSITHIALSVCLSVCKHISTLYVNSISFIFMAITADIVLQKHWNDCFICVKSASLYLSMLFCLFIGTSCLSPTGLCRCGIVAHWFQLIQL